MSINRVKSSAAVGLVLAAVFAPAAFGQQDLRNPDTRESAAEQAYVDLRNPDTRDVADQGGVSPKVTVVEIPVAAPSDGGLNWGDAGIGASAMLGLVLLTAGTLGVTQRKRPRHRTATTS